MDLWWWLHPLVPASARGAQSQHHHLCVGGWVIPKDVESNPIKGSLKSITIITTTITIVSRSGADADAGGGDDGGGAGWILMGAAIAIALKLGTKITAGSSARQSWCVYQ